MKTGLEEVKKDTAVLREQMNEFTKILSAVYKDQIAELNAKEIKANENKAL